MSSRKANSAKWRLSRNNDTLLFNFRNQVQDADEALKLLHKTFGEDNIVAVKDLTNAVEELTKERAVLEVLFTNNGVRRRALTEGIQWYDKDSQGLLTVQAIPTINKNFKYTVLEIRSLPLEDKYMTIWKVSSSLAKHECFKYNDTKVALEDVYFVDGKTINAYDGHICIVLKGLYDIYNNKANSTIFLEDYQGEFATTCKIYHVYCKTCRTFNDHDTADCADMSKDAAM